jgi:hemerythrin superfamily protein
MSGRSAGSRAKSSGSRAKSSSSRRKGASGRSARNQQSATYAVKLLTQDHRAVSDLLEKFEEAGQGAKRSIAERICRTLTVHAQIEAELFYPAAREALSAADSHLVAEAAVEHASIKDLISQIESMGDVDEMYEAKVKVLGEYVKHHVEEEENELFPKVERTSLDLDALGERLAARRKELMGEEAGEMSAEHDEEAEEEPMHKGGRSRSGSRGHRPTLIHSGRRR